MNAWQMMGILFLCCGSAKAEGPKIVEEQIVEAVECASKQDPTQDIRRLEVHTKEAGCVLAYFKFGKVQRIANARRGVDICKEELKKVRTTLESSSYLCK